MAAWVAQYVVAAAVFLALDLLWLGKVGRGLYERRIGHLMAPRPNGAAALAFYAIFVAGLVVFVIHPALEDGSWTRALIGGAFFGLVCYATWDLTNLAVMRDFPSSIVPIDMGWGTALAGSVSLATYAVCQALPDWAR